MDTNSGASAGKCAKRRPRRPVLRHDEFRSDIRELVRPLRLRRFNNIDWDFMVEWFLLDK